MEAKVRQLVNDLEPEIIAFARELVQTPSITENEGEIAGRVRDKMRALDYDRVWIDELGNVIGSVGNGPTSILFDSHMDTVAADDPGEWTYPPFSGEIVDGKLYGRGSVDMKGALAASVFAGHIIKRLGLGKDKTILIIASVMEEDYDGETVFSMCRGLEKLPDFAVICEPSGLGIALGHKGRALLKVTSRGISAHGSAPEKGVNAVYKLGPLAQRVEALNRTITRGGDETGTVALTGFNSRAVSLNAIPHECTAFLDRRLVKGEDKAVITAEMNKLLEGMDASWDVYDKRGRSYTGCPVVLHSFLPSWEIAPDHELTLALEKSYKALMDEKPRRFKWDFCTNGVATAGRLNIPTIGFGPGDSKKAHMVDECCEVSQILDSTGVYALLPEFL